MCTRSKEENKFQFIASSSAYSYYSKRWEKHFTSKHQQIFSILNTLFASHKGTHTKATRFLMLLCAWFSCKMKKMCSLVRNEIIVWDTFVNISSRVLACFTYFSLNRTQYLLAFMYRLKGINNGVANVYSTYEGWKTRYSWKQMIIWRNVRKKKTT